MPTELRQIVPPAAEPVQVSDLKGVLRLDSGDTTWDSTLQSYLVAARIDFESWSRMRLITQKWLLRADSFPGMSVRYDRNGFPQLALPFPPFQSIDFVNYVDTAGNLQALKRDVSYGNDTPDFYEYQLSPGGEVQPALLTPNWARPWPPQRLVPANTIVQFRCGYGGPLTVSTSANSDVLISPGFKFNPDDAPQMVGDQGIRICIPGAGPAVDGQASSLITHVASVDANGVATLADPATAAVANVSAWLGESVPENIRVSILLHAQFFFEQGGVVDQAVPRVVTALRGAKRNLVS